MEDIADEMIQAGEDPETIQSVTWMGEEELAERYLENWYSIKDTADELGIDESEVREYSRDSWSDYDYE